MDYKFYLQKHNFRFNKALGQNFITDTNLLKAIAADSGAAPGDIIVEVGAGAGALTAALSDLVGPDGRVVAFEIDKNLAPVLGDTLAGRDNIRLVFGDALKTDSTELSGLTGGRPYRVAANLPYYITTPLLFHFIESESPPQSITVMVQKEVADRLAAQPGTPEYGALTVAAGALYGARVCRKVPRSLFYPAPDVDSAVVRLDYNPGKFGEFDRAAFKRLVRAVFTHRRKTLANNLISEYGITRADADEAVRVLGKEPSVRGETLSVAEFVKLQCIIHNA